MVLLVVLVLVVVLVVVVGGTGVVAVDCVESDLRLADTAVGVMFGRCEREHMDRHKSEDVLMAADIASLYDLVP